MTARDDNPVAAMSRGETQVEAMHRIQADWEASEAADAETFVHAHWTSGRPLCSVEQSVGAVKPFTRRVLTCDECIGLLS